jgi:hypothetical protein
LILKEAYCRGDFEFHRRVLVEFLKQSRDLWIALLPGLFPVFLRGKPVKVLVHLVHTLPAPPFPLVNKRKAEGNALPLKEAFAVNRAGIGGQLQRNIEQEPLGRLQASCGRFAQRSQELPSRAGAEYIRDIQKKRARGVSPLPNGRRQEARERHRPKGCVRCSTDEHPCHTFHGIVSLPRLQ